MGNTAAMLEQARICSRAAASNIKRPTQARILEKTLSHVLKEFSFDFKGKKEDEVKEALERAYEDVAAAVFDGTGSARTIKSCRYKAPKAMQAEFERQLSNIMRYVSYEDQTPQANIIALDEKVPVLFAGLFFEPHFDMLIDRGGCYEVRSYRNASPKVKSTGRVNKASDDYHLALLEMAGREKVRSLGLPMKPVVASSFHMKARGDSTAKRNVYFESRREENIISRDEPESDLKRLEKEVGTIDITNRCCDKKTCEQCTLNDVCNLEFVVHKLEEEKPVEVPPIKSFNLTGEQRKFVEQTDGVIRANAVAGSGKTTCLILKIMYLIELGVDPSHILVLTFGNEASKEISTRLKAYANGAYAGADLDYDKVVVRTYNSFGQELLDEYYSVLGFTEAPHLIEDFDKMEIIESLWEKYDFKNLNDANPTMDMIYAKGAVSVLKECIDKMKSVHVKTESDVAAAIPKYAAGPEVPKYLALYNEYNDELKARNSIDYEDQLRLLEGLDKANVFDQMPFEYVLVDEFQDSNPNQIDIISNIVKKGPDVKGVTFVGDELQSIFGFRFATPENFVTLDKRFPGLEDIMLEDNFRSENPIITMANKLIDRTAKIKKQILCHSREKGYAPVVRAYTKEEEQEIFVKQIKSLVARGIPAKEIAVLCRTKKQLNEYYDLLEKEGIPSILKVPKILRDEAFVKAIVALASYMDGFEDRVGLALYARTINEDPFSAGVLDQVDQEIQSGLLRCTTEAERIAYFFSLIEHLREDYIGDAFAKKIEARSPHSLKDILSYCIKYRDFGIKEPISTVRDDSDAVNLITCHSAKGLEWDNVLLSLRGFKSDEEEERLLYVSITRSRKRLLVSYDDTDHKQRRLVDLLL